MDNKQTFWWWVATEIKFLNGWKESRKLFFEGRDEFEAMDKMVKETGDFLPDCQRIKGSVGGPYVSKEEAVRYANLLPRDIKTA